MIRPGLCSVTLAGQSVEQVVETARRGGLEGIEWWGKDHVPPGDFTAAEKAARLTREAGLVISSYGSYYRAGVSEAQGLSFATVLETARRLGAPSIRVWAGDRNHADASAELIQAVVDDTLRIADRAAAANSSVTFEFHGGSLTDRNETALRFADQVRHPAVFFSWQPPLGYDVEHCVKGLESLRPRLRTLHVFHWTIGSPDENTVNETIRPLRASDFYRHPLADGEDRWRRYFAAAAATGREHFALLEFVKGDTPEQALADAAVLTRLVAPYVARA